MPDFVHLHLHSQFSLLDGANRLSEVAEAAARLGMPALALTDHGNLFGAIDFYHAAKRAGIKPIIGIEAYVAQGSRVDRDPARSSSNHLVLLARNELGYRNLLKLTTRSYLEGFYYKPRIDRELLERHADGLIALSACLKGEINERILSRQEREAEATAGTYRDLFGTGNFYLELQDHGLPAQRQANEVLQRMGRRLGIPLVASNDCHYLRRDDAFAHDVLLCIGTGRMVSEADRLRYHADQFFLKSPAEMAALFPDLPEALDNTLAIAERCNLELHTDSYHLPRFDVPAGHTLDSYFEQVAREGLEVRLSELRRRRERQEVRWPEEAYRKRLEMELGVIERMGFSGYFLVVWDFIRFARERGIPVGPGRGSAAGSLVSYALRITDIDPLQYDLLFERFLNPDRISMPDIDIDFCMRRRGEVIDYVNEKYGRDRVAQIITFGTLAAKAVVRDVGRVLGLPYAKVDRIAKLLPDATRSLAEAAREVDSLAVEVARDPEVRQIVEVGSRLEGLTRHASVHAAGVVIAPGPIEELVPLYRTPNDEVLTQWDMTVIEKLGLLKMDFLGLRTLTVIDDTLKTLALQGRPLDLEAVPLDDPAVFALFCDGRTSGIFQFESTGMRELLRRARPSRFEDLAALNALYRPGALEKHMDETFCRRKHGKERVSYVLPETRAILEETYGVIAYQEQVMQIAVEIAGFTMGEADVLRKAMGKKKAEVMVEQRAKFVAGAERKGFARRKAEELWAYIEPFAGYGFNKSHSVAYAMVAYKTAYLKVHYPVAFMAAMLSSEMAATESVVKYIAECREMGISVLPPDVNESEWPFVVVGDAVRFGLGAIKGLGEGAAEAILETRRRVGPFRSLAHFAREVEGRQVNQKVFECLVKSGAFDGFGQDRAVLLASVGRAIDDAQRRRRERDAGQGSLFGGGTESDPPLAEVPPWSEEERLRCEKSALGFYLSGNPLRRFEADLAHLVSHTTAELRQWVDGRVAAGGLISGVRRIKVKSGQNAGRTMGHFTLEDLTGTIVVTLFADQLQRFEPLLEEEAVVIVRGSLRERGAECELLAEEIEPIEQAAKRLITALEVVLRPDTPTNDLLRIRDLLAEHHGEVPVRLACELPGGRVWITPEERFAVDCGPVLLEQLEAILGAGRVRPVSASLIVN